jgi:3-hydroxymyristoyl/3-hydroxydecanoyl-(acyl carrier protein) dehydratase
MINIEDELKNCFSLIESENESHFVYKILIPKEFRFFHGHFPNSPVLPAVGIIDVTQFLLNQFYKSKIFNFPEISKVKIKSPVLPNTLIEIHYKINCEIHHEVKDTKVECSWFCKHEESQTLVAQLSFKACATSS